MFFRTRRKKLAKVAFSRLKTVLSTNFENGQEGSDASFRTAQDDNWINLNTTDDNAYSTPVIAGPASTSGLTSKAYSGGTAGNYAEIPHLGKYRLDGEFSIKIIWRPAELFDMPRTLIAKGGFYLAFFGNKAHVQGDNRVKILNGLAFPSLTVRKWSTIILSRDNKNDLYLSVDGDKQKIATNLVGNIWTPDNLSAVTIGAWEEDNYMSGADGYIDDIEVIASKPAPAPLTVGGKYIAGKSFTLDGTSGIQTQQNMVSLLNGQDFCVEATFRCENAQTGNLATVLGNWAQTGPNGAGLVIGCSLSATGFVLNTYFGPDSLNAVMLTAGELKKNTEYKLAFQKKGTVLSLYVNDNLVQQTNRPASYFTSNLPNPALPLGIGSYWGVTGVFASNTSSIVPFKGVIKDIEITREAIFP